MILLTCNEQQKEDPVTKDEAEKFVESRKRIRMLDDWPKVEVLVIRESKKHPGLFNVFLGEDNGTNS